MVTEQDILQAKILVIDDDLTTLKILESIIKKAGYNSITTFTDPCEAINIYSELKPDLVILDLNMPKMHGFQVFEEIKKKEVHYPPVVILTNEEEQEVRYKALGLGARDFLNKPYDRVEVLMRFHNLIETRLLNNQLDEKQKILARELSDTQLDVINRLARAVEYRDSETGLHIVRMSHYSSILASGLGFPEDECKIIRSASSLHDIGKIGIPDVILQKPGKLTVEEFDIMKTHTTIGGEILSGSNSRFLKMAQEIALAHHEKWNGKGYPKGLKEEEIPILGRVCGLADVFDALTTARPYKPAWSTEKTVEEIKVQSGQHFDPELVKMFVKMLPEILKVHDKYKDPDFEAEGNR